jgi:predicted HAD superfamily Cof-like phosphohydrolase
MYFNTYMKKELELVAEFNKKVGSPVLTSPSLIAEERALFRHSLIAEEVAEYKEGVAGQDLENIAKELADILFATYGTILEHGLQDKMPEIFAEVHRSNMSKDFARYKAVKGRNYTPADIKKLLT